MASLLPALVLGSILAAAQTNVGQISGTARDSSGAVLPGVAIAVVNTDTQLTRTEVTDERGAYRDESLDAAEAFAPRDENGRPIKGQLNFHDSMNPNITVTSGSYGRIADTRPARQMQLGVRLEF